jgi:hypothetical protein
MASRTAFLSSIFLFAGLSGCGGENGEGGVPPQSGALAQDYELTVVLGDGSHVSSVAYIYDSTGQAIVSGGVEGGVVVFDLKDVEPQTLSIVSEGGAAIDPVGGEQVDLKFNELRSRVTLGNDSTVIAAVNYLTDLANVMDSPSVLSDLLGFDVFSVDPIKFDITQPDTTDSSRARFVLDGLSRFAYMEGTSILPLIDLMKNDLFDGRLDGQGVSGQLYLSGRELSSRRYREGLSLSSVRQAHASDYLSPFFIEYADAIGSSESGLLVGSSLYKVSTSPLLVSADSHPNGAAVSGDVQFTFAVSEIVGVDSVRVLLNGSDLFESQYSYTSENYNGALAVSLNTQLYLNGENTLQIILTDAIGVTADQSFTYVFTNGGAVVTTGYPSPGSHVKGRVNVGASGSYDETSCTISIDGTPRVPATIIKSPTNCYTAVETTGLNDGSHTFQVTATAANGTSDSYHGSFYVDNTAPAITDVSPASSTYVTGNFDIEASLSDNLALWKGNLYHDSILLTSTLHQSAYTVNSTNYAEGATDFRVVAEDRAGNTDEHTVSVVIDNAAPTVEITFPWDGEVVTSSFSLRWNQGDSVGFCDDVYTAKIIVGGIEYADAFNDRGQYPININNRPAGNNEIRVVVTDCAGHQSSHSITVNFSPN